MRPDLNKMLKQAQRMQAEIARVQDELKDESVEASVGGGAVRVVMTGDLRLVSVSLDPAAIDPDDVEMLEDLIVAAVNEAIRSAQELANAKMMAVTGGMGDLGIPGLM